MQEIKSHSYAQGMLSSRPPQGNSIFLKPTFCLPVQCSHFIRGSSLQHPGQTPTWPSSLQMVFLASSTITLQASLTGFTTPNKLQWLPTPKTKSTFLSLTLRILGCQTKAQFPHSLGQTHLRFPRFPPNCLSAHASVPFVLCTFAHAVPSTQPVLPPFAVHLGSDVTSSREPLHPAWELCCSLNAPRVPSYQSRAHVCLYICLPKRL